MASGSARCSSGVGGGIVDAGASVGDLTAVVTTEPTVDYRVGDVVRLERERIVVPRTGLGERVRLGVFEVDSADRSEMGVVHAVTGVVLIGDPVEHRWPHHLAGFGFVADERSAGLNRGSVRPGDGLLDLDAEHQRTVVTTGLELGHRGERGERTGGTGALVTHRRNAPQPVDHGGGHRTEVGLAGVAQPECVADVNRLDRISAEFRRLERGEHRLLHQISDCLALAAEVSGEIGLVHTEDVDVAHGGHCYYTGQPMAPWRRAVPKCGWLAFSRGGWHG